MRSLWRIIGTELMVVILLVGLGLSAFAHAASDDSSRLESTLRLKDFTIPWLFPLGNPANLGGTCAAIPTGVGFINPVNNSSDRGRKVTSEVLADGTQVIEQDDLKTGTAVDDFGAIYRFVYKNQLVLNVSLGLPANVNVKMIDTFKLTGNGLHMNASFDWRWDYEAPDGVVVNLQPDADFPVDFFIFATADGVAPAPGVTNWQQLKTQGDPFNCDPL